jgi:putative ABC transport system ATP-binding protein
VVHQGLLLFDELSLMQNIHLKNRITKFKTEAQINAMVNSLSLNNQRNQKVKTLSYGQKQRLAIIRALCQPFDFIFLDEPFSHLDNDNAQTAWQLISDEAHEQKAGVVLTSLGNTHNIRFDKIYQL